MLFSSLKRWLFGDNHASPFTKAPLPAEQLIPPELRPYLENHNWLNLGYPPYREGYPGQVQGEWFMRQYQRKRIERIEGSVGLPNDEYRRYVEPILVNFAEWAHLLPASEHYHHTGPGGLLWHSLEVANLTLAVCLITAFDTAETPARRSARRWRWSVAAVAAGLLHDAGKALTHLRATDFEGRLEWNPEQETLHQWSVRHRLDRYFLHWNARRHEKHVQVSVGLAQKLIPDEVVAWILEGGRDIHEALLDAIAGAENGSPLTGLVRRADSVSVKHDLLRGPSHAEVRETGVPVIRLVSDAMLRLLDMGQWTVNTPGSRVWVATDGVYIVWHYGAKEIVELLVKDGIAAIPGAPETLLTLLADHGLAQRRDDGELYWPVTPHVLCRNGKGPILRCLKLSSPEVLFPHVPVPLPTSIRLGKAGEQVELIAPSEQRPLEQTRPTSAPTTVAVGRLVPESGEATPNRPNGESAPEPTRSVISIPCLPAEPRIPSTPDPAAVKAQPKPAALAPANRNAQPEEPEKKDPDTGLERRQPATSPLVPAAEPLLMAHAPSNPASEPQPPAFPRKNAQGKISLAELLGEPSLPPCPQNPLQPRSESPGPRLKLQGHAAGRLTPSQKVRLTPAGIALLNAQPVLANKFVACLDQLKTLRPVAGRVFVPLNKTPFDDDDLLPLCDSDWLWRDFTREGAPLTRQVNRRRGFLLTVPLSALFCRLGELDWGIFDIGSLPEDKIAPYHGYLAAVLEQARPERLGSVDTLAIGESRLEILAKQLDVSKRDVEAAVLGLRDAVRIPVRKKLYIRARPEEVASQSD
ncbi:conjugal transfer pilus assembly protein TraI [Azotobacter beijerinckii]|uniref:Conjugal transfer pilus assembly protein TraI n=1 Tax=Azotobacter beijerinckii TaxID=170623 RepID=A0A1H6Z9N8_9GAMM|nr:MobH family relaxase [Azotobacter beijerinckii]SEJ50018.1 conjugal transfer pilus assembly protein TraI [Azotobacter beijerinckii]